MEQFPKKAWMQLAKNYTPSSIWDT